MNELKYPFLMRILPPEEGNNYLTKFPSLQRSTASVKCLWSIRILQSLRGTVFKHQSSIKTGISSRLNFRCFRVK